MEATRPPAGPSVALPARHRSSAIPLTLLFGALIVYASLYPFTGWHLPGVPLWKFLLLPWPRWWTWFDLIANLLGYVPFGALMFIALVRSGWRTRSAFITASLAGAALSLLMETLQNFLPQRIPSNVDAALNLAGTAFGAGLGALAHLRGGIDRWQSIRDRWFARRSASGLVLLLTWPIGLLFPQPLPLGVGQVIPRVRDMLLEALQNSSAEAWAERWLQADPMARPLPPAGDFLVVVLGLLGPCLVAFSISVPGWRRVALGFVAPLVAAAITTLSTALNFAPQHAFAWATPQTVWALGTGATLALLLAWLPYRAAAALGLIVLTLMISLVTQAPADPYYASSLQAWEQGRFIRFHGLAQWVGWLWPYAAMLHLGAVLTMRRQRGPIEPAAGEAASAGR
ncbi:VanZ family protein [Piscinibacter sakaiensis]|uniref:VanZ family protein n=1 Tax=Piscinibacter sakaiensis TaxID=1547922 RepID=UPI003AAB90FE